ncbi:MAG: MmoB/DmpM family protein [Candidatus Competibacteraceae bacterium]
MANNMVYLALQNNEDARPIIEAIAEDNPHATINHYPAMVKIDAPGRLTVKRVSVEEKLGRDWDPQEIQINLISISGNVVESEEEFAVERLS